MTQGVLSGLRVLDMADGIAGPVAAMLLAEAGADVVKVEPPGGSPDRARAGFCTWNRSKRGVVADVTVPPGAAVVQQLLTATDVLIHNFSPERAAALGLDTAELCARHPRLIVSSVLGWPANHSRAREPVDEFLTLAALGICDEQMPLDREGPLYIRAPFAGWAAAYLAAIGVMARVLHRDRSGRGGPAHTSLVQGALVPMAMHWSRAEHPSVALATGMPKAGRGSQWTLFECADGQWVHTMPPGPDATPLMQQLLADMDPAVRAAADAAVPLTVGGYAGVGAHQVAMRLRTSAQWLAELWAHDVPAQRAAAYGEVLKDPQARANNYVIDLDDAEHGTITVPGFAFSIDPPLRVIRVAPALGEHQDEVLRDWSHAAGRDATWVSTDPSVSTDPTAPADLSVAPLDGMRVLDCGNFLAGPYGAQVLADLGATVVKLEAVTGDPMRPADWPFAGCQRGKRAIALDLKSPAAAAIRDALIGWADVVHHNLRLPAARKLGLDGDSVRNVNPKAIFCHVSSYGPVGERTDWPGYDQLFQAQCGWEVLGAGQGNPPMWHRFGFMDHLCALSSALATLLARFHQLRTGETHEVRASLLGAGALTNSETVLLPEGTFAAFPVLDKEQLGVSEGRRIFQTADGWIAVAADGAALYAATLDLFDVHTGDALRNALLAMPSTRALALLASVGVPSGPLNLNQREAFFDDPANLSAGLVASYPHAAWGMVEQPGALWSFGDLQLRLELAPPILGEHTVEILHELGVTDDEIAELLAARTVAAAADR